MLGRKATGEGTEEGGSALIFRMTVEKIVDDKIVKKREVIMADAYEKLITAKDDTRGAARISLGYGQSTDYAKEKYNIQVTLTCDQNTDALDRAVELAISAIQGINSTVLEKMLNEQGS